MRKGIAGTALIAALIFTAVIGGCYYDNEERLYPDAGSGCDTLNVTFSKSVLPILQTNCLSCHGAANYTANGGGLNFEDFTLVKAVAEGGMLLGAITHNPSYSPMPKNGAKLDTCSISKIKQWIDAGSINNLP
jgi:hypothetical protein